MDFVIVMEHSPDLCPHSNAVARKQFERIPEFNETAKQMGIEMVFGGIPVPEHKAFIVLKAASFETVRKLMVESGLVQTNTIKIYRTESFEEFGNEIKNSVPLF
jgi:hypothetical protein